MAKSITSAFIVLVAGSAAVAGVQNRYNTHGTILVPGFPESQFSINFHTFPQAEDLDPATDIGRYEATIDGLALEAGIELSGTGFVQMNFPEQRIDLIFDNATLTIPGIGEVPFTDEFFVEVIVLNDDQPVETFQEGFDPPLETTVTLVPGVDATVLTEQFTFIEHCPGDIVDTLNVDSFDLNAVLAEFGCTEGCTADTDGDGDVDSVDLNNVLSGFGQDCQGAP